ncbi:MAG TPA: lytic transglycosylase domain-containing protein, partial [Spirochaetota bacterium]|nr:lytic transglycosylase domain-containing protein [Spirochaetota bacterium]
MLDGINNVFARINEIKNGSKNLSTSLKPEKIVEFENALKDKLSKVNSDKTNSEPVHPFLKSKQSEFEMKENENLEKKESDKKELIKTSVKKSSEKYGVSEDLINAVIRVESNFDKDAVSRVGAMGLMQLMPKTALELGVEKPFDIEQNIDGGTKY